MDIRLLKIKGLYGHLNHTIDLSSSISIIMGENGVGKTAILRIIKAVYQNDFRTLFQIDFKELEISFTSLKAGRIIYTKESEDKILIKSSSKINQQFFVSKDDLEYTVPERYKEKGNSLWVDLTTHNLYNESEFVKLLGGLPYRIPDSKIQSWYDKIFKSSTVHMVRTQRLYSYSELNSNSSLMMIDSYSKDLKEYLQSELTKVGQKAADLDRTFPTRLVKHLKANRTYTIQDLASEFDQLENLRNKLSKIGFLNNENLDFDELRNSKKKAFEDRVLMNVFKLYIYDSREKLNHYKLVADRVTLFLDIINAQLQKKELCVDPSIGFYVKKKVDSDYYMSNDSIDLCRLSSGEQNEIIMFYELIFKCSDCNIILVDEPEISLHLQWLQTMLDNFRKVIEQSGTKLLIATHSPDFVGDNYDLVQNLSYE